jgi:hypothetical protein
MEASLEVTHKFCARDGNLFSVSVIAIGGGSFTLEYKPLLSPSQYSVAKSLDVWVLDAQNAPIVGASLAIAFKDRTFLWATTDALGVARFEGPKLAIADVYVAKAGFSALVLKGQDTTKSMHLRLQDGGSTSSILFTGRSGHIPGLQGLLTVAENVLIPSAESPRIDYYIYSDEVQIIGARSGLANLIEGHSWRLRDRLGATLEVKPIATTGYATLLEYRKVAVAP